MLMLLLNVAGSLHLIFFFFQAEDGIRDLTVTGVQTCALPIFSADASRTTLVSTPATFYPKVLLTKAMRRHSVIGRQIPWTHSIRSTSAQCPMTSVTVSCFPVSLRCPGASKLRPFSRQPPHGLTTASKVRTYWESAVAAETTTSWSSTAIPQT